MIITETATIKEVEHYCGDSSVSVSQEVKNLVASAGQRLKALFTADPLFGGLNEEEIAGLLAVTKVTARTPGSDTPQSSSPS
jgi:hypothetical protein